MTIKRMLIVNRGEIAVRIIRAARELGIETVQAVSAADRDILAARTADRVVDIAPAPAVKSYLDHDALLRAVIESGVDAIHPGYGHLSENADFAGMIEAQGLIFVGPAAATIRTMGEGECKTASCACRHNSRSGFKFGGQAFFAAADLTAEQ